jgi:4-amino-4-deoxychorismate lyase
VTLLALAVAGRGLLDPDEPVLHADDVALLRGRAAFETLRVYGGRPFRMAEHLERLAASAARIGLPQVSAEELEELAATALEAAGTKECVLRFYWTGGREGTRRPTALAMVSRLPADLEELRARGLRLISLQLGLDAALRAASPWLLGGVKSTSYAVNMAAEEEARRRGADDAVFVARDETVLEGPVTNIWWREGSTLCTPTLELGILAGVTRSQILRSTEELGYLVDQGQFPLARLAAAEEAFTTSSVREVMPVVELDGKPLGNGKPGPAARALQQALRDAAYGPPGAAR